MKWLDNMKASANAFKDWGRVLTIIGAVMAGALVVIAAADSERFAMPISIRRISALTACRASRLTRQISTWYCPI